MKKIVAILCAILVAATSFAQTIPFQKGYVINGNLKGENNGYATLRSYFRDGNETVDSAKIEKGKFSFRKDVKEVIPALLTINGKRNIRVYLEPATYDIKIDPKNSNNINIKGSKTTDEWNNITTPTKGEDFNVHMQRLDKWVMNNSNHIFCADIISSFLAYNWGYEELNKTLNTLEKPATGTYHYIKLRERSESLSKIAIGKRAPDFISKTPNNNQIGLSSYLRGKKFVLIDFWASWCKPCREENPNLVAAWNRFNSKGFDILGVSLDRDKQAWVNAINSDGLAWENVSDLNLWNGDVAKLYSINAIPSNFLVDKNGTIIAKNLKGQELIDKLEELTKSYGYTIEGDIAGVSDGEATLTLLLENGEKKSYSSDIRNGKFSFTGYVDFTCMAQIILPMRNGEISFFLDNDKISISGNKAKLEEIQIVGSSINDNFNQVINNCNKSKNPLNCLKNYADKNPSSVYTPLIISSYLAPYLNNLELTSMVNSLNGDAKKMYQYKLLSDFISEEQKKENIGEKIKDFTLKNTEGSDINLMSFIEGKKYILVDFWASWCKPCRLENPNLVSAYKQFSNKGFYIIGVSLDDNKEAWISGIKADKLTWTNVSDLKKWNSSVVSLYNLESIPQNILIDNNGTIVARNLKGDALIETLKQLLK